MRYLLRQIVPPAVALLGMLLAWELIVRLVGVPAYLVPPPSAIAASAWHHADALAGGLWLTGAAAVGGFALSAVVGVVAAVALASARTIERAFYPFIVFLQTVPLIAIAPLLVIWFGRGLRPVMVAAFIVSLFPVIANTFTGLKSVDPNLRDLFRLYGAGPLARLVKLDLPSALPSLFTGLRIAAGLSVIGAIVADMFGSYVVDDVALGMMVYEANANQRTELLFAAVGLASLLGLAMFGAVNAAGHLLLRHWHASEQDG